MGWKWCYQSLPCSSSASIISLSFKSPKYPWDGEMEHENSVTVFAEEGYTRTCSQSFAEQCFNMPWRFFLGGFPSLPFAWSLFSWKPYSKTNRTTTVSTGRPLHPTPPLYKWASRYTELPNTTQWTGKRTNAWYSVPVLPRTSVSYQLALGRPQTKIKYKKVEAPGRINQFTCFYQLS